MTSSRAAIIYQRLQEAFHPEQLEVIDESEKHHGHAGYQGGNRHFAVIIRAACFNNLARLEAHRKIYAALADFIPNQVHAIRIQILQ